MVLRLARAKHLPVGASAEGAMAQAIRDLVSGMRTHLADDAKKSGGDAVASSVYSSAALSVDLRDEWRLHDLYQAPADQVLRRWQGRLEGLFRERMPTDGGHGLWRLVDWQELLVDCGLLDDHAFGCVFFIFLEALSLVSVSTFHKYFCFPQTLPIHFFLERNCFAFLIWSLFSVFSISEANLAFFYAKFTVVDTTRDIIRFEVCLLALLI